MAGKGTTIILIYVGGYDGNRYRNEIWKFNSANEEWEITSLTLSKATSSHAVAVFEKIVTTTTTTTTTKTFTTTTASTGPGNAINYYNFQFWLVNSQECKIQCRINNIADVRQ